MDGDCEILLSSRKFNVERRRFSVPGRPPVMREIVTHPGAVIILPLLTDKDIIVIHNYRYAVGRELVELPAGTLEPGEAPAVCAARELEEETGYRAGRIEPFGEFFTTPGITNERMHCFVAHELERTRQTLDDTEQIRPEIVPLSRAIDWVQEGRIADGKTIVVLLRYAREWRRRG